MRNVGTAVILSFAAVTFIYGCGGSSPTRVGEDGGVDAGAGGGTGGGGGGVPCVPATCEDLADVENQRDACGASPDGCGGFVTCGGCEGALYCATEADGVSRCNDPVSVCSPVDQATACADIDGKKVCGAASDGCSTTFDCGGCDAGDVCGLGGQGPDGESLCASPSCTPATCAGEGVVCGTIGDGCGGTLDCSAAAGGGCTGGQVCDFATGQCEAPSCSPVTAAVACASACGVVSDGCDGQIDCAAAGYGCPDGKTCGGGGTPGVCGAGSCTPLSAATVCPGKCGFVGDGCSGAYDCSAPANGGVACSGADYCGGGGVNTCGHPACTALTFAAACTATGRDCGFVSDGCGGLVDCGTCASGDVCGLEAANVCGSPVCTPIAVALACAGKCGEVPDGCGGTYACDGSNGGLVCPSDQWCGYETPNVCGAPGCTPKTCATQGYECGYAPDGCGGIVDCWAELGFATNACPGISEACIGTPASCVAGTVTCTGPLCPAVPTCAPESPTRIVGRVTTPDGELGVPNAIVYIPEDPSAALPAISEGPSCDRCADEDLGPVLAAAVTDHTGAFTIEGDIPAGVAFEIVVKVGKWRRVAGIGAGVVAGCATTDLSNAYTRLPGHVADGLDGTHLPLMAIATGDADAMECVLYKLGIARSEFTIPSDGGRIHMYRADGAHMGCAPLAQPCVRVSGTGQNPCRNAACYTDPTTCGGCSVDDDVCQWQLPACGEPVDLSVDASVLRDADTTNGHFDDYDMVIWDCEGEEEDRTATQEDMMRGYVDAGGRFFASHFSYDWFYQNAGIGESANWGTGSATSDRGYVSLGRPRANQTRIETFARWLSNEGAATVTFSGASDPVFGYFQINAPRDFAASVNPGSDEWVYRSTDASEATGLPFSPPYTSVQQYSFNTPFGAGADQICGRVAYSGFHVAGTNSTGTDVYFPDHCGTATTLTPQEKVLAFMLFDLSTCVSEGEPPLPPSCTPLELADVCTAGVCGAHSNGCGEVVDCGDTCPSGEYCGPGGTCIEQTCTTLSCADYGANCGELPDGCGGTVSCGTCAGGQVCGYLQPNVCGQATCTPLACADLGAECGIVGDGCGASIDCGDCPTGEACGAGGPNLCGVGACDPADCAEQMFDCGLAGDGCGGVIDCGECASPDACGGGGMPNVCGHPACTPVDCTDLAAECGYIGDGCGGSLFCGVCPGGGVCGGAGPNRCGAACVPRNCTDAGAECGAVSDDCGGILECGPCPIGESCGAQEANQCGVGTCTPRTCAEAGAECGDIGDGCGGVLDCGVCTVVGESCGGDGVPNQCGPGTGGCTPADCATLGAQCGPVGDGCGGLLDCGGCGVGEYCVSNFCLYVVPL